MKRRITGLVGMFAVGCLLGAWISQDEPAVDGLVQNNQYLLMEKKEEPVKLDWSADDKAWVQKVSEAYVPVHGVAIDEELALWGKYVITALSDDIAGALSTYNPGLWYRLESAYVDSITESVDHPGQYRVIVKVNTENTIERLEFKVITKEKTEFIRYSQIKV